MIDVKKDSAEAPVVMKKERFDDEIE